MVRETDVDNSIALLTRKQRLWPGRSVFRVGSKAVAPKFQEPADLAPKNRKDIFYGSVNYHWRNDTARPQSLNLFIPH